jgi:uncharacterized membrane-anchored protein
VAYILTRPLGGSTGDYLSGARLGTLATSLVFLGCIVATVVYLTLTGRDRTERVHHEECPAAASAEPVECRCEALAA